MKGKNAKRDIYQDLKDEKRSQQPGQGENKKRATTRFGLRFKVKALIMPENEPVHSFIRQQII